MELLKVALDFIAKIANPLVVCLLFVLFRKEVGGIFAVLKDILEEVKARRLRLSIGNWTVGDLEQLQKADLDSADKIIQELLSPAAPLAVGYVENFVVRMKKSEDGIHFKLLNDTASLTTGVYTIYIPPILTDLEAVSPDLIRAKYPGMDVQKISIESKTPGGRIITGSAIRHEGRLLPVDVPQTLTSIRLVFKFREEQLKVKGKMGAEQIKKLEADNLKQFADILEDKIRELEMSKCVRVIREQSQLFT